MNKNNSNIPVSGSLKNIPRSKSLTPAVLGVASSHGVKLPLNMTSEKQKELLSKLEEWRKARRVKLAASILEKQKQIEKPKTQIPILTLKSKPVPLRNDGSWKIQNRQSVFERLYKNSGKIKKAENAVSCTKPIQTPQPNIKTPTILSFEKPRKPTKVLLVEKEKTEPLHNVIDNNKESTAPEEISGGNHDENEKEKETATLEISVENHDDDLMDDIMKAKSQMNKNNSVRICKENFCKTVKATKPVLYLKSGQIGSESLKPIKNELAIKSLPFAVSSKVTQTKNQKNSLRRSVSTIFRQKSKIDVGVRRSISANNLTEIILNVQELNQNSEQILPRSSRDNVKRNKNEMYTKSVSFVTPKSNESLISVHLRTKLEDWLKMKGLSLDGYRHLRCFGITNKYKPFPKTSILNSFENSHYVTAPNTPVDDSDKENVTPTVMQQVDEKDLKNWLNELHHLIVKVKYPPEKCEEWLDAIRKKCTNCSQLPIYWECLAALHESKGDLKSAIEDYERAIIKGGEVDAVGNCLAELFDKMLIEQKKNSKRKLEKGLDPKNIFKSTIIKFALQQKALKERSSEIEPSVRQQVYIATPVRRSTRIQTPFKSTEVNSLQSLTPELLKNVEFRLNESLLNVN